MGDLDWSERRRALRVPVRGVAVFYAEEGAVHGTIENLSSSGALVTIANAPYEDMIDVELRLGGETGWVSARMVRIERTARKWRVAVQFDRVDDELRVAIEQAIEHAMRAAHKKPVLVIDDRSTRRTDLTKRLAARGLTPLSPRTPLEAIELLTRTQLHVNVCLLAPSFGQSVAELRTLVADSFPWVTTAEISDDIDATVERAVRAWSTTRIARFSAAIA